MSLGIIYNYFLISNITYKKNYIYIYIIIQLTVLDLYFQMFRKNDLCDTTQSDRGEVFLLDPRSDMNFIFVSRFANSKVVT